LVEGALDGTAAALEPVPSFEVALALVLTPGGGVVAG
jgi:hypothetical protein